MLVLGHSRKAVRLLTMRSIAHIWAQLHEESFPRLGGAPQVVVLDNLRGAPIGTTPSSTRCTATCSPHLSLN